jgi:hypothetical protein
MNKKNVLIVTTVVVVAAVICYLIFNFNGKSLSYVGISINPDVQLAVNEDNIVEDVIPINEDADIITSDLELVGMNVEAASEEIIDAAIETGYIDEYSDENVIVVTAANEDEEIRQDLEERVIAALNDNFEERKIFPVIITGVSDEMKAEASTYGISNGKMLLVSRAAALDTTLSKEQLATLSVKEIQQEIKENVIERREALATSKEELKNKFQQEKEALKVTNRERVQTLERTILEGSGIDTSRMTEQEKKDAVSTALKSKKVEIHVRVTEIKDEIRSNSENETYTEVKEKITNIKERINQSRNGKE